MAGKSHKNMQAERARSVPGNAVVRAEADMVQTLKKQDRRAYQKAIGQGLREFFNAVVSEPIPDEFLDLLKKMDEEKTGEAR